MALADSVSLRWNSDSNEFEPIAYRHLTWNIDDVGTMYGAILVERIRTYKVRIFDLQDRFDRILCGTRLLRFGTPFSFDELQRTVDRLLTLNANFVQNEGDVSIVILMSPGVEPIHSSNYGLRPTCLLHLSPLPFARMGNWYRSGTPLISGRYRAVPGTCWPTTIKSRSRLPYALSQLEIENTEELYSLELLRTTQNTIADTAVANIITVSSDGTLRTSPPEDALSGCTLKSLERLLKVHGRRIEHEPITDERLAAAEEVLLVGSTCGIWHARSVDDRVIRDGNIGPTGLMLQALWRDHVECDYIKQALQRAGLDS